MNTAHSAWHILSVQYLLIIVNITNFFRTPVPQEDIDSPPPHSYHSAKTASSLLKIILFIFDLFQVDSL